MKRIAFLLTIIMVFTTLFVGCKKDTDATSSAAQNGVLSVEDVKYIDADGESVYRIVRPDGNNDAVAIATEIYKSMKSILGVNTKNISDSVDDDDAYEVLVGNTNRPESALALQYLKEQTEARYNDFVICTIGKKIVINSKSIEGVTAAAEYFIENYIKTEGIKGGISYTYKTEGDFVDIIVNGANISEFSFIRPHFNISHLTQLEIENAVNNFYRKTGHMLPILHDTKTEETDYEIIVGNCERSGVEKIDNYDTYKITVADKKVYINGGSPYATAMAVTEFGKMVEQGNLVSVEGSYNETLANYDKATTYHPTWIDDFDGDSIDFTKWKLMDTVEAGKNDKKTNNLKNI